MSRARLLVSLAVLVLVNCRQVSAQPFQPVRKVTTWYTDRSLVDIEIVGSTSLVPDTHRLEPDRVLRFRLERAYIHSLLAKAEPGFEIILLGVDWDSGLPSSLIVATSSNGRFREEIKDVPRLSNNERSRRSLEVEISSDHAAAALVKGSAVWRTCQGSNIGNDLFTYEWEGRRDCRRAPTLLERKIAAYDNDLALRVDCADGRMGHTCHLAFPFEAFAVKVSFHRDHLPRWRQVVDFTRAFLKSKQYGQ
jgi:hypothetical protein